MSLAAVAAMSWPETILVLGVIGFVMFLIAIATATWVENRKTRIAASQQDAMRQLVSRYEQLAESTLDVQQRVAADVSDLRSRAVSIEQILRTVE
jgi:hypothetical protein